MIKDKSLLDYTTFFSPNEYNIKTYKKQLKYYWNNFNNLELKLMVPLHHCKWKCLVFHKFIYHSLMDWWKKLDFGYEK